MPFSDTAVVRVAAEKLKTVTFIASILGLLLLLTGAATLGVAGENVGFPTFNFGPLLVGIVVRSK